MEFSEISTNILAAATVHVQASLRTGTDDERTRNQAFAEMRHADEQFRDALLELVQWIKDRQQSW